MADRLHIDEFLGLVTGINMPPGNTARTMRNLVRNVRRGQLSHAQGYAKRWADGLPQATNAEGESYLKPAAHGISDIAWKHLKYFSVPDHGGADIAVLVSQHTLTGFFTGSPETQRMGIWARPYWNGAEWVDAWRELTEMYVFENLTGIIPFPEFGAPFPIATIDDGRYGFAEADPDGKVFNDSYFVNWTMIYEDRSDDYNYDLVKACGWHTDEALGTFYRIEPQASTGWTGVHGSNTKLTLCRHFLNRDLPSDGRAEIFPVLSELRLTSGNRDTDGSVLTGFRTKSIPVGSGVEPNPRETESIDNLVMDCGTLDVYKYAAGIVIGAIDAAAENNIPAGTFYLRATLAMDDGSETAWMDTHQNSNFGSVGGPWDGIVQKNDISPGAPFVIKLVCFKSRGALPVRAKELRVYMGTDARYLYLVKRIDLNDAALWQSGFVPYDTIDGIHHSWNTTVWAGDLSAAVTIDAVDWNAPGPEASVQMGRGTSDTGIMRYTRGAVINNRAYLCGIRTADGLKPNLIARSAKNGDGQLTIDVFGNSAAELLSVEYNDGDEVVAVGNASDRILVLKRRSLVLLTETGRGDYQREIITRAVGICAARTLAAFDNYLLWGDYNGVYAFSPAGMQLINKAWLSDWKVLTREQKEAAFAIFDREQRTYRLYAAGIEYAYEIDGATDEGGVDRAGNQWLNWLPVHTPLVYAAEGNGTVNFLSAAQVYRVGAATLHDGEEMEVLWESNAIRVPAGVGYDILLGKFVVVYKSGIDLTFSLYLDERDTAVQTYTLPAEKTLVELYAPLSARCRTFRIAIAGELTEEGTTLMVQVVDGYYQTIPGMSV